MMGPFNVYPVRVSVCVKQPTSRVVKWDGVQ